MNLKKILSGFLAAAMAVTTMVTATFSTSAAETTNVVVYDGDLAAWGNTPVDISSKGTPVSGATVTIEYGDAEYDADNNNQVFQIIGSDWQNPDYVEAKTEAGSGSHTFQLNELPGTSFFIMAGHLANHFKVTVSEIEAPAFEGDSFALTKNEPYNWQGMDPFSSSVSASTLADLMKKVEGIEVSFKVNGAVSGANKDFDMSLLSYQINIQSGSLWIVGGTSTYDSTTKMVKVTFNGIAEAITGVLNGASASDANFGGFRLVAMCEKDNATEEIRVYHESYTVNVTEPATKHTITITPSTNGTVTADKTTAAKGEKVTLTITPDEGYELDTLSIKTATAATGFGTDNTFTMLDGDVTVTATFKKSEVALTGITLDKTTAAVLVGKTVALTATKDPENTTDKTEITWMSDTPAVATVSATGVVTGVKAGTAVITAACGEKTATCTVTVSAEAKPCTAITLDKTTAKVMKNATVTLTATAAPADTTDEITWASSDTSIATVDQNGKVTGVARGTADITVTCGTKSATCKVSVNEEETVTAPSSPSEPAKIFPSAVTNGKYNENDVFVISAADVAAAKSVTVTVTDNTGKKTTKDVTECYKKVTYTAADGTTDTITANGNDCLLAVTVTGIPDGTTVTVSIAVNK